MKKPRSSDNEDRGSNGHIWGMSCEFQGFMSLQTQPSLHDSGMLRKAQSQFWPHLCSHRYISQDPVFAIWEQPKSFCWLNYCLTLRTSYTLKNCFSPDWGAKRNDGLNGQTPLIVISMMLSLSDCRTESDIFDCSLLLFIDLFLIES